MKKIIYLALAALALPGCKQNKDMSYGVEISWLVPG